MTTFPDDVYAIHLAKQTDVDLVEYVTKYATKAMLDFIEWSEGRREDARREKSAD